MKLDKIKDYLKSFPIGARTLKTGLAVAISMFICEFFNIPHSIFAGSATVANMQPAVGKSIRHASQQIEVHFIAVFTAIILGLLVEPRPYVMGLAAIIIISVCTKLKIKTSLPMGIVAAIFVLGAPSHDFLQHALIRSAVIFIGVGVAITINMTIMPPKFEKKLIESLLDLNKRASLCLEETVNSYLIASPAYEENRENREIEFKKKLKKAENLYEFYCNEWQVNFHSHAEKEALFKEYISYNKVLWKNINDIHFLATERKTRREKANDPPISTEFISINEFIMEVMGDLKKYNVALRKKVAGEDIEDFPDIRIWSRMNPIINKWHDKMKIDSFYMHALIEISIITYKLRWAVKESTKLLNMNN